MAKQTVNIGASANDGTGDTIREAFNKVNDNFTEVYDNIDVANSVVTDTSPSLGGDLDVAGFSIVANTGSGIVNIVPSTAGYVRLDGIKIDGTVITTHTNNTNITLDPHGTGKVLAEKIAFTGGTIDGVTIGATQPPTGTFDLLTVNTALQATGGSIDDIMIGSTTPNTGAFTSLDASELNADLINMAGHIIPTTDITRDLGTNAKKWRTLYVDVINGNSINLTGAIAGTFTGDLTGNVTGDLYGNADTATALQTARTINGVSFDGTSNITVTADANTLSNTTLNSTVVNSSLTSVGTLTALTIGAGAAINAGNNVIANVADPLTNQDAANKLYVDTAITNLIDGAVPALDTLKEIADSLNNDTDIATTIVNGLAAKLDTAGGTMTGELYLNADPVSGTEAATKNYVDTQVSSAISAATTISSDDTSVVVTDNGVVDGKVEITVDGNLMVTVGPANISAESHRIVDVTDPSGPQDAATKKYVDDQIDGLAAVASSGQYGDLTGTPTLALVATSGSFTNLVDAPDLVDITCDSVFANVSIHTSGSMECEGMSVKQNLVVGQLGVGSLSAVDFTDNGAGGATIHQIKNNLLDIHSSGTLTIGATNGLAIQGLTYPSADGTAGQMIVTDGAGALSFATPFSGNYADLSGAPTIPADVSDLTDTTNLLFDGAYSSLTGAPTIPADVSDLTDTTNLLFSGAYADLTGAPTLATVATSGDYNDLTNTPTIPAGLLDLGITDGTNGQVLTTDGAGNFTFTTVSGGGSFSGDYNDLTNKPTIPADVSDLTDTGGLLFSGAYGDLTGTPTIPADVSDLTDTGNLLFSGAYADLTGAPSIPSTVLDLGITDGTSGQVLTTDGAGNFTFANTSVDANDLTGTTLASAVVNSSLTSVGTLTDLTVTGTTTLNGVDSNVTRRAFGLVDYDVTVTLDDLSASVTNSPNGQLKLQTSGSWQATGWTETFQSSGTPSVNNWINLPLNSGFSPASGAMPNQGNGCRCVISDQSPSAKMYQITVMRAGTSGNMWNISIERLV